MLVVCIDWEEQMGGYVAYDDMFGWYGVGETEMAALCHLVDVVMEDYQDLEQNADRLLPDLEAKLHRMRKVLTNEMVIEVK